MSDPTTSDVFQGGLLLAKGNEDILDIIQEEVGLWNVVDNNHLDEEPNVLNSFTPSSRDLLLSVFSFVSVVINIGSEFGFAKAIPFSYSGIVHLAAKLF